MRRVLTFLSTFAGLALAASAQEEYALPQPAPELAAFEVMLGDFAGSGTIRMTPSSEPEAWTSTTRTERVLDGHFVEENTHVETPFGQMVFRTVHGWDGENEEYVCHGLGSMGGREYQLTWLAEDKLQGITHGYQGDQPFIERWTNTYAEDSYDILVEVAVGSAPFYRQIEGTMRRTEAPLPARAIEASAKLRPAMEELESLERMSGDYRFTGTATMAAGAPPMEVAGLETIEWILDGMVLSSHVAGSPMDYEGQGYIYWNPTERSLVSVGFNNMGTYGSMRASWVGDELVFINAGKMMGEPAVERMAIQFDEHGMITIHSDRTPALGAPFRSFEGSYERVVPEPAAEAAALIYKSGSCCDKALQAGDACAHPCCVEATARGEVCTRCN